MKSYIITFADSKWHSLNIDDFTDFSESLKTDLTCTLITFQIGDLIRHFISNNYKRLPTIINMESLDKQMSQDGSDKYSFKNWRIIKALMHHKIIDHSFRLKPSTLKLFMEHASLLFKNLYHKDESERKRFQDIELKINRLIYDRQLRGIRVSADLAKIKCRELEKEIYKIKNLFQLKHNIFSPDNDKQQEEWLKSKGYNIIQTPLYTFKTRRNEDSVCNLFYELKRNIQDLESLTFILSQWGGADRTYPLYNGFGTITSRIIMKQPSLQNLRKTNRNVIIADIGKEIFYIDYSQFEAGILASLSKDGLLIDLYNTDIYCDLAEKVIGNRDKRAEAKIIFYRYMYGDKSLNSKATSYFKQFRSLETFRKLIEKSAVEDGRVGTINGNYRNCSDENENWALSHIIQATASLIYKNALIRVSEEVEDVDFLMPMHDATLYQISKVPFASPKQAVEKIYKEEFKKICPEIEPKVNIGEFY